MRFCLFILFSVFLCAQAQKIVPPDWAQLGILPKAQQVSDNSMYSLFIEGDLARIQAEVEALGGVYKYGYDRYAAVELPAIAVAKLLSNQQDLYIQDARIPGGILMDVARQNANVNAVHQGQAPLIQGYDGEDVIVGVIDAGIDFNHQDFKNDDGSSRILYVWDQLVTGNSPTPFTYGNECNWIELENGTCSHEEPEVWSGHGTTVTGIAAGNGRRVGEMIGVAPKADIIVVSVDFGANFLSRTVDAVKYIFDKADALGKPCVVNTSIGTVYGSHDGRDFASELIAAMIQAKPGRILVAAAGNSNNINMAVPSNSRIPFHLGYQVDSIERFTWMRYNSSIGLIGYELWADSIDITNVEMSVGPEHMDSFFVREQLPWFDIHDYEWSANYQDFELTQMDHGSVLISGDKQNGVYHLVFQINPNNTSDYWRFSTRGAGRFDIWCSAFSHGTSNIVWNNLPDTSIMPEVVNYMLPDFNKSMVSSWQNNDAVISVANYNSRTEYIDYTGNLHNTNSESGNPISILGELFYTSSWGPTRDERLKPDISAPGTTILSVGNEDYIAALLGNGSTHKVDSSGYYNRQGGTSMASPIVAGAAALFLQKYPDATASIFQQVLHATALRDTFTGPNANAQFGHGKVNTFGIMSYDMVLGCTDTGAINYDAAANIDDGTCIAKVYGCTDAEANNYNPAANVDDGSCTYDSVVHISASHEDLRYAKVFPNPAQSTIHFDIAWDAAPATAQLELLDVQGAVLFSAEIANGQVYRKNLSASWAAGVYHYRVQFADQTILHSGQFLIQ